MKGTAGAQVSAAEHKTGSWEGSGGRQSWGWRLGPTIFSPPSPWRSPTPLPKTSSSLSFPYRQNLIKKPFEIWPRVAMGIARSSLFLTLFIAAGFGGAQVMGRIFPLTTLLP